MISINKHNFRLAAKQEWKAVFSCIPFFPTVYSLPIVNTPRHSLCYSRQTYNGRIITQAHHIQRGSFWVF